jgi:crotonobetainyl-CoA:carnitine CoA-transferase CaiB-like acyl-CoA transferase
MGDLGNGFLVAIGVLQALYHRERTDGGAGQEVGCSILGACLAASSGTFAFPDGSGPDRPKLDAQQLGFNALYRLYETADGWICLAAVTEDHWHRLCAVLRSAYGISRLSEIPRTQNGELAGLLEAAFATRSAADWFAALDAAGVPVEISAPGFVTAAADQPFVHFSATPASVPGEAPELGEHTDEVLAELGLPDDVVAAVHAECADRARA